MELIKVGIIEDDKIIHQSLVRSIEMYQAMELSFNAYSIEESLELMSNPDFNIPDVILLDIGLPGMDGIAGIPFIKQKLKDVNIIMLTTYDESEKIFSALCAGACSYISKKTSLKTIMDSIFIVYRGGSFMSPSIARKISDHFSPKKEVVKQKSQLSDRRMEIVKELSNGLTYQQIAEKLNISIDTVRSHIKHIYRALHVNSKMEVVTMFRDGSI